MEYTRNLPQRFLIICGIALLFGSNVVAQTQPLKAPAGLTLEELENLGVRFDATNKSYHFNSFTFNYTANNFPFAHISLERGAKQIDLPDFMQDAVIRKFTATATRRFGYLDSDTQEEPQFLVSSAYVTYAVWPESASVTIISVDKTLPPAISGLTTNEPREDEAGFVIGALNETQKIRSLASINGVKIEKLERDLVDLKWLGEVDRYKPEALLPQMADDNEWVRSQRLSHQIIAYPLRYLERLYELGLLNNYAPTHVDYAGIPLSVNVREMTVQSQFVPFVADENQQVGYVNLEVVNLSTGHQVYFNNIAGRLIDAFGFYGGKKSHNRLEPSKLAKMFGADQEKYAVFLAQDPVAQLVAGKSAVVIDSSNALGRLESLTSLAGNSRLLRNGGYRVVVKDAELLEHLAYLAGNEAGRMYAKPYEHLPAILSRTEFALPAEGVSLGIEHVERLGWLIAMLPENKAASLWQELQPFNLASPDDTTEIIPGWHISYSLTQLFQLLAYNSKKPKLVATAQALLKKLPLRDIDPITLTRAFWDAVVAYGPEAWDDSKRRDFYAQLSVEAPYIRAYWQQQWDVNRSLLEAHGIKPAGTAVTLEDIHNWRIPADTMLRAFEEQWRFANRSAITKQFKRPLQFSDIIELLGIIKRRSTNAGQSLNSYDLQYLNALGLDPQLLSTAERLATQDNINSDTVIFSMLFNGQAQGAQIIEAWSAQLPSSLTPEVRSTVSALLQSIGRNAESRGVTIGNALVASVIATIPSTGKEVFIAFATLCKPEFAPFFASDYLQWEPLPVIKPFESVVLQMNRSLPKGAVAFAGTSFEYNGYELSTRNAAGQKVALQISGQRIVLTIY